MRYQAEEIERSAHRVRYRIAFPPGSPLFAGHFPGNPILPGVAQVQVCAELLAASLQRTVRVQELESVRFRKPLTPAMPCELTIDLDGDLDGDLADDLADGGSRVAFAYHTDSGPIADGTMRITNGQPAEAGDE